MRIAKARILIVSSSYPPVVGGVQTVAHNLAKQLIGYGHQVRVVTNRYPLSLSAKENIEGVTIDRLLFISPNSDYLRQKRMDLFLASFYFYPKSYWQLKKIVRQFHPDVISVHFPDHQIPFVLKLRRQFDFRLVVSLHGHDVQRIDNRLAWSNGRMHDSDYSWRANNRLQSILREADAVTACSHDLLDRAKEVEPTILGKGQVIYNGIDSTRFQEKDCHSHPRPYVLALGRLTRKKGFDLLLEAFAQDQDTQSKADLIIAGDGEERDALRARVEQLGLGRTVHFFGQASVQEVVRLLNGSLSVVVPSRTEPFGLVALEALAAGKPLLATKTGGLQEFLVELNASGAENPLSVNGTFHESGRPCIVLVEPTVDGLARGLKQMFELLSNGARTGNGYCLPDKYSWAQVARNYESVLLGSTH